MWQVESNVVKLHIFNVYRLGIIHWWRLAFMGTDGLAIFGFEVIERTVGAKKIIFQQTLLSNDPQQNTLSTTDPNWIEARNVLFETQAKEK